MKMLEEYHDVLIEIEIIKENYPLNDSPKNINDQF